MMDVVIGIDLGTSYTKAAARREDGAIVATSRIDSPEWTGGEATLGNAHDAWTCVEQVVGKLRPILTTVDARIVAVCVSGIAPTLTVLDETNKARAYAIPYSSREGLQAATSAVKCDAELTAQRVRALLEAARKARFNQPRITDLVGYINWCLSDTVSINGIAVAEMGISEEEASNGVFAVDAMQPTPLVAARERAGEISRWAATSVGLHAGLPICGGCPDTMASVVGAGLSGSSETMLYLGTFGSLLRLRAGVDELLAADRWTADPFRWVLSVPGLGRQLEALARKWFGPRRAEECLTRLDKVASRVRAGAGGLLFLVPRWVNGMKSVGAFSFDPPGHLTAGSISTKSRAALEGLGYAVRVIADDLSAPIWVSGGGARSRAWLGALATVIGVDLQVRTMAWEASGTAEIAARMVWPRITASREVCEVGPASAADQSLIADNVQRARRLYQQQGWI